MAVIAMVVQQVSRTTPANFTDNKTSAIAANSYTIPNDGNTRLIASAASGANVTVVTPGSVDGLAVGDLVVAAGTAKTVVFGPFPVSVYSEVLTVTVSANCDLMAIRG
jgi:hypothetical protein